MPAYGAVQVEGDGDEREQRSLRGCSATRPEAADFGHTLPVHAKGGLRKRRGLGKIIAAKQMISRPRPEMQARLPRRAFALWVLVLRSSLKWIAARGAFRARRYGGS